MEALGHGVPLVIPGQSEDEVVARLAWTGAALRRATSKPAEAGIPAADTMTGNPASRAHAGRPQAEIRRHGPFGR